MKTGYFKFDNSKVIGLHLFASEQTANQQNKKMNCKFSRAGRNVSDVPLLNEHLVHK